MNKIINKSFFIKILKKLTNRFFRVNLFLIATFCSTYSMANEEDFPKNKFTIFWENDIGFSDRYYTNGVKFQYSNLGDDWLVVKPQKYLANLLMKNEKDTITWQNISFGQQMYVPSSILDTQPLPNDRPYAGYLYLSAGVNIATKNTLSSLDISFGIIGPESFAEQTQKFVHSIIGADTPQGWDYQLKNEPAILIAYDYSKRVFSTGDNLAYSSDLIATAGFDLGNVNTNAHARALLRFGYNMPYTFDSATIRSSSSTEAVYYVEREPFSLYGYVGASVSAVAYNAFLDGNMWSNSISVDKQWFVANGNFGIVTIIDNFDFSLNLSIMSKEFKTQAHSPHLYWSVKLGYMF